MTEIDDRGAADSQLSGRLFGHATAGESCSAEVRSGSIAAITPSGAVYELRLDGASLSYGGTDSDQLVVTSVGDGGKLVLYLPRRLALPILSRMGNVWLDRELEQLAVQHTSKRRRSAILLGVFAATAALVLVLGYLAVDVGIAWGVRRVPVSWEVKLGQSLMEQMAEPSVRLVDSEVRAGVDVIVARLLTAVGPTDYEFEVHVVEDDTVNAYALPGGQIAVHTALIAKCRSPEELAGVLAHELQHVLQRHSLEKIALALKWHIALSLIAGDLGTVSEVLLANGAELFSLSNSRDAEREADWTGIELLYAARIDPEGLATFFEVMGDGVSDMSIASYLSTHPADGERAASIRERIAAHGRAPTEPFDLDWEVWKRVVASADASQESGE